MKIRNRYETIIEKIFISNYVDGSKVVNFAREDLIMTANSLSISVPKNVGDIIYSFRYRSELPETIRAKAPDGFEWVISGVGSGKYSFRLESVNQIEPNRSMLAIKIPDATPQIILKYTNNDEQALLARIRYNRLIDIFLSITAYSVQNHLRTNVKGVGQIEIDELYVGLNQSGAHFIVPVQAKIGKDRVGVVQSKQDLAFCLDRFPSLVSRAVSAQFLGDDTIVMFEVALVDGQVKIVTEKHYQLVPGSEISDENLNTYHGFMPGA